MTAFEKAEMTTCQVNIAEWTPCGKTQPCLDHSSSQKAACSCGKPFPEDGGREGVCECCSTCATAARATGRVQAEAEALLEAAVGDPKWLPRIAHLHQLAVLAHEAVTSQESSFVRLIATPGEQFDRDSEVMRSIEEYRNAGKGTASA